MKNQISILKIAILIGAIVLTGCQQNEKIIIKEVGASPSPSLPDLSQEGGSDTGGENGIGCSDNKTCGPLESFQVDVYEREEFKTFIDPIIQKLGKIYRPLAADLIHLSRERRWYFVPVELNKIPAQKIGVSFKTDQLALHKKKEIWISSVFYDKMEMRKKAILLLHELVMGINLMKFQNPVDQCLAEAAKNLIDPGNESDYRFARTVCMRDSDSNILDPRGIYLDGEDHSNIRDLTKILMDELDKVDEAELKAWLKSRKFRTYKDL